jgi:hypothetical protein
MTERDMPEDWKMLTAEALIQRCVLHIQRIAELERILSASRADNSKLLDDHGVALARIAELEDENRLCNAPAYAAGTVIRDLEDELTLASNLIKDLEAQLQAAQELVQVDDDEDLHDPINEGGQIQTMYSGTAFIITGYVIEADCIHLPAGYCIAKVKSTA